MDRLRVLDFVYRTPWALQEASLRSLLDVAHAWAAGRVESNAEARARLRAMRPRRASGPRAVLRAAADPLFRESQKRDVAVVPIYGIIAHRAAMVDDVCGPGGTSTESVGRQIEALVADDDVRAIVLDVDSPGGSVFGVEELAAQIYAARGKKRVVAVSNATAASAAYWIAAQADEVVITPSGETGSVGVFGAHEDTRRAVEMAGVHIELISAGKYKVEGSQWVELTAGARAHMQAQVNRYYETFVRAVARGRGVQVQADAIGDGTAFGGGRTFTAEEAVALRLADRVATLDEVVRGLRSDPSGLRADDTRRRRARLASLQ